MVTICACTSTRPTEMTRALERMVQRAALGTEWPAYGFVDGSPFLARAHDIQLPRGPARWAAALVGPGNGGELLLDAPTLRPGRIDSFRSFLSNLKGKATASPLFGVSIIPRGDHAVIARDPIGSRPLFLAGADPAFYCTQPRLLPSGGPSPEPFAPGIALDAPSGKTTPLPMRPPCADQGPTGVEDLIQGLSKAIEALPEPRLVFFSGGIDSLVIAKLAIDKGETVLITAGVTGSRDLRRARTVAASLQAAFVPVRIPKEQIPRDVVELRGILGTDSPLSIGVSLPLYHAAMEASRMGLQIGMTGQGADELFGGYHRYLNDPDPERTMDQDLMRLHSRGLDAFNLAAAAAGVRAFMPYLDDDIVHLARSAPVEEKIRGGERKILLRELGRSLGLKDSDVSAKKLAIQYGSGVNAEVLRALRRCCA